MARRVRARRTGCGGAGTGPRRALGAAAAPAAAAYGTAPGRSFRLWMVMPPGTKEKYA